MPRFLNNQDMTGLSISLNLKESEELSYIEKCPRCKKKFDTRYAALSRKDNKTKICSECGTAEALETFSKHYNKQKEAETVLKLNDKVKFNNNGQEIEATISEIKPNSDNIKVTDTNGQSYDVNKGALSLVIENENKLKEGFREDIPYKERKKADLERRLNSTIDALNTAADDEREALEKEREEISQELDNINAELDALSQAPLDESVDLDSVINGEGVLYRNNDGVILKIQKSSDAPSPEEYDEGYITGWNRGEDEEYDKEQDRKYEVAKKAYEDGEVFEAIEMSKDLDTISTYAYLYGIDELKDFVQAENLKEVKTKMVIDESDSDALDRTLGYKKLAGSKILDAKLYKTDKGYAFYIGGQRIKSNFLDDAKSDDEAIDIVGKYVNLDESLDEAKVKGLTMLKNQGNVYMFEAKGQDFTHIVGENYDKDEQILENAETYNNKEDADKDYMERCGIGV